MLAAQYGTDYRDLGPLAGIWTLDFGTCYIRNLRIEELANLTNNFTTTLFATAMIYYQRDPSINRV